ncbi:MAG TPA: glycosyltransferase [Pseudonocardiaceae bacterium]|nr:glycosyltransferase [Pseudonocardiaceae bacterium]
MWSIILPGSANAASAPGADQIPQAKKRGLLVSTANPYPIVTNGCARLVHDYQVTMFPQYDMYFVLTRTGDWAPMQLFHQGKALDTGLHIDDLQALDFAFVVFIGFKDNKFTRRLAELHPSFCLTDTYPHPDLPEGLFRGILSHHATKQHPHLLLMGGSYDDNVFYPDRKNEEFILAVGRIHPDKNQLELVSSYRQEIFEKYGLPLYLAGGVDDPEYFGEMKRYIDGVAVASSIDPVDPLAMDSWRSAQEIARLCNRARLFVSASPKESFGMALIEAIACGTTCVVNGDYRGFVASDLRPHVHGHITAPQGCVVELVDQALRDDVRIDGSRWAKKYSVSEMRQALTRFIAERM